MRRAPLVRVIGLLTIAACAGCTSHPNLQFQNTSTSTNPSMVVGVVASAGNGEVTVRWSHNPSNEDVTSFAVESASADFSTWSESLPNAALNTGLTCCSFKISGLDNDHSYFFSVGARNAIGMGPWSSTISALPPGWLGTQTFGAATADYANAVALDASGNAYVAGSTAGAIGPEGNAGGTDGVLLKYDRRGRLLWAHQWGTATDDAFYGVTVTPNGVVFVTGTVSIQSNASAVLLRYEPDGTHSWTKTFLSGSGTGQAIASGTDGRLFMAMASYGTFGTFYTAGSAAEGYCGDAAIGEFDSAGTLVWGSQIGSGVGSGSCSLGQAIDVPLAVSVDSNGVTIAGTTTGVFAGQTAAGGSDMFVSRFRRSDGTYLWTRQLGSSSDDRFTGVITDAAGASYAAGYTAGVLPTQSSSGNNDVVAGAWSSDGSELWETQFGTSGSDLGASVTLVNGTLVLAGSTYSGTIGSVSSDVFIARLNPGVGTVLKTSQAVSPGSQETTAGVVAYPTGSTLVVGSTTPIAATAPDGFLMKFDAADNPL